ncbi:MAG: transglutaminase family protein [Vicinamibacteria bacterium]
MPESLPRIERLLLALTLAAGLFAAGALAAAPLLLAALVARELRPAGDVAARWRGIARAAADLLVLGAFVLAGAWTLGPLDAADLARLRRPLALALGTAAAAGLAGAGRGWAPHRSLLPAALALFVLGALDAEPRRWQVALATGAVALSAWLLLRTDGVERRPRAPRLWPAGLFLLAAGVLAAWLAQSLSWAQPHVEAAVLRLLQPAGAQSGVDFSFTSGIGDVEALFLSRRIVLRVHTSVPQRLRARAFVRFDGRAWSAGPASAAEDLVPAPALAPAFRREFGPLPGRPLAISQAVADGRIARGAVATLVVHVGPHAESLLAPAGMLFVALPAEGARLDSQGILTPSPQARVEIYALLSRPGAVAAGAEPADVARLLELPEDLDPRLRTLAASLAGPEAGVEARIAGVLGHLARGYRYALGVPRGPGPPLSRFLFVTRAGYCESFASAAAVLLRLQGVPTRYVVGYEVRDEARAGDHYVVRERDAHAWIEAFVPGQGWRELDPTPSAARSALLAEASPWRASLLEGARSFLAELGARLRTAGTAAALLWLVQLARVPLGTLVALGLAALLAWRLRRTRLAAASAAAVDRRAPELRALARGVDAAFARAGRPRPAWRAPLEHLDSLPSAALPAAKREVLARAIARLYRAQFAAEPLGADECSALRGGLGAA